VLAVYGVYAGGLVFRERLPCRHGQVQPGREREPDEECLPCRKMAISMVTAYQLTTGWYDPELTAELVVSESVAVEDLVDPDVPSPAIWDLNLRELSDPQLRDFLLKPQGGAREIARRIFRLVADHRRGAFSAASAELLPVPRAPIFPDVPEDRGHFPGPMGRLVRPAARDSRPRLYLCSENVTKRHPPR